ncbi:WD-repeat protein [Novymonas esmeraldas]|uniref:Pre-mRNA-processing factor 19 n=1 Tax=Novymonas esmeraldas TaxID=1808958 RepID=A0AAW0EXR8_9TRYP
MRCHISQRVPAQPVISVSSGLLFERSLVERYVDEHGRCPVTGAPLRREDLVSVKGAASASATAAASGSLGAASIPTLLERLQAEWEATALESFALRQHVTQLQMELAHALQQYDAACRVIARLGKQLDAHARDDNGRAAAPVADTAGDSSAAAAAAAAAAAVVVVPAEVLRSMDAVEAAERAARQQQRRKAAAAPAETSPPPAPSRLAEVAQWTAAPAPHAGVRVAAASTDAVFTSATVGDHAVVRHSSADGAVVARGLGHTASVHTLATLPCGTRLLSAAEDDTVRVWTTSGAALTAQHVLRYAGGVAAMSQRTISGVYALCGAADGALYLSDVDSGAHVVVTAPLSSTAALLSCVELHPYASLAAVGLHGGELQVWDAREMRADTVITLPRGDAAHARLCSASFSADCMSLAVGLASGAAYVWDLRHVTSPVAVLPPPTERAIPATVRYAPSGRVLAIAGDGVALHDCARLSHTPAADAATATATADAGVCDMCWTADGAELLCGAVDAVVRLYSTA